ncbi:alpha/beta hydrolase [Gordonia humi]|uniref:Acetyl esterase/lipase n=1 Tax=Gordonia humi TaxID=686429 RepID=A0A840EXU4_9ACTN|nr:alpha/beta hydrolase [Gordonia humi]MBB4136401.1 acetyl esterase/lipase [Gordonia humi]
MRRHRIAPPVPAVATKRTKAAAAATRYGLGTFTDVIGTSRIGVATSRRLIALLMGAFGTTPADTRVVYVDDGAVRGEWVYGPGADLGSSRVIYFLHGSAYMMCSPTTHRGYAARMSAATGLPVFVLDYRLAPEHRFPAAHDDVEAGWNWLRDQGYASRDIVVVGDSAGGHLAVGLVLNRASAGRAVPAGVVTASPVIDPTFALAAGQERRRRDPMITARAARRLVELYTADADPSDPRLAIDFRGSAAAPPMLVQAGGAEMLSADARYVVEQVTAHGGRADLEIWPGQMHVFQALDRLGPEADQALLRIRDFIASALENARISEGAAS